MVFDRASRDLDIVEWDRVIGELLIIFVSFARDQYNVSRLGELDRAVNRLRAIDNFFVAIRAKTFFDLGDDRVRIFFARIIRGDDGVIGKSDLPSRHQRALLAVAIAPAAKNNNQASRLKFAQGFDHIRKRVGSVRIIDENLKLSFGRNQFQAARHLR